jgi:hypothetical protein
VSPGLVDRWDETNGVGRHPMHGDEMQYEVRRGHLVGGGGYVMCGTEKSPVRDEPFTFHQ